MWGRWVVALLVAIGGLATGAGTRVAEPPRPEPETKLDLALRRVVTAGGAQRVRVIVSAASGRAQDAAFAVTSQGGRILDRFNSIGAVTTVVPAEQLLSLAADWRVLSLSSDGVVESAQRRARAAGGHADGNGNGGSGGRGPGHGRGAEPRDGDEPRNGGGSWQTENLAENHLLNTLGLHDTPWDGNRVTVAVVDSGVEAWEEVWGQWDFRHGRDPAFSGAEFPTDPYGHGTHVAGLIANSAKYSHGLYQGLAPAATLVSLRVLDEHGVGHTTDVIRALDWILANDRLIQVDVVNLSLGHPILEPADRDPLVKAVEALTRAGIPVVVSAGNYGYDRETGETGYAGITSPGNAPSAITVGAVDTRLTDGRWDDTVARFSSRGPTWYDGYAKPDVVAPGSALVSTMTETSQILYDNPQLQVESGDLEGMPHVRLSGTSMAAGVTTGVVAQMIEAQRRRFGHDAALTPNAVKAILHYTALDMGRDPLTQGAGGLNGDGAVTLASSLDSTTAVGQWWLASGVSETSTIDGSTHIWSQRLVWGDRLMWGNEVYTHEEAWGLPIVWGDRLVWGDRIIWGHADDSVVWGNRLIWGNRIVWGNDAIGFDDGSGIVYGDRIVWGNVTADRLIWGNLDDGTSGTMGVR